MLYDRILIKYGELSIKGKNKKSFLDKLIRTIRHKCASLTALKFERTHDRLYIILNGEDAQDVISCLNKVFGLHAYSLCARCDSNLEDIKDLALKIIKYEVKEKTTFKVETKRALKTFPLTSIEASQEIARHVLRESDLLIVDVRKPQMRLRIDIRSEGTYIMTNEIKGLGGLPVGIDGKGLLMLSGGIDSPVAGYLVQKRGVEIEAIHFSSPPYTSEMAKQKVLQLIEKLAHYASNSKVKLYNIPFTKLQKAIFDHCPQSYGITIMRRMMYRISSEVAKINNNLIIVNGENLGQVASQTMHSMLAINEVTNMPIIRPLVAFDKLEIIDIAKKIDTYAISIEPYEDCCTVFVPANPVTKPDINKCIQYESYFDFQPLIEECIKNVEIIEIKEGQVINVFQSNDECPIADLF